ncbi:delta-sarcoglycan-like [Dermatophagoides pteronyssinus]|uniref:delta-sarcoglycan-like n=1 Tax=Dermatophagoides pteronyssinus TaxID=6956 RepID=UPI003F66FEB1
MSIVDDCGGGVRYVDRHSQMIIIDNHRHSRSHSHSNSRQSSSLLMFQNYHPMMMNDNNGQQQQQQQINYERRRQSGQILETQLDDDNYNDENYDHYSNENQQSSTIIINNEPRYYNENFDSECPTMRMEQQQSEHQLQEIDPIIDNQMMLIYPSDDIVDNDEYLLQQQLQQQQEVGIYGWRKKFLYILLAINIVMVGINFALAFWIISVLGFSTNGIGPIDFGSIDTTTISNNNDQIIRIHGSTVFEKLLFARHLRSWPNDELRMTTKNGDLIFRSLSNDSSSMNENRLIISNDKITLITDHFEVYDRKNSLMFALDSEPTDQTRTTRQTINQSESKSEQQQQQQITIRSNAIKFLNDNNNNLNLPLSLQTPSIINTINDELRLYSPQSRVLLRGPQSLYLESKLGDISIVTYDDLRLQSNAGRITFDSRSIYMQHLWTDNTTKTLIGNQTFMDQDDESKLFTKPIVYQVCVCSKSGRLFLANANQPCQVKSYRDCR